MSLTHNFIPGALVLSLLAAGAPAGAAAADAVAERPAERGPVGRKVYTVPRDLADSGSASDVLRTLPAVEVDAEGEVSLRGDANVTLLIDGRSSIELSPGWRALTLQQMAASTVESIEIITGLSAQFPSGGAGVINIVTKAARLRARPSP